ncbi:hypothetical protein NGM99_00895 [Mesorhizobium sp. RP14(2022)]|uniref:Uncharacterized protein n=1 Tax=Mesorhizobium liriopis TaxID=2953882 RepID=A0ABT1C2F7_9HYPH|nr:hypothetical protein [Mesorhizobium liriopis]MCO6048346.1 hypothetical protein [Mesorhizobium liriopis]
MRYLLILPLLLTPLSAQAQESSTERFQLQRTDDGYVRLDTETGAMSICREDGTQLVCRQAADEREAMTSETERLQSRVDALEDRIAALEKKPTQVLPTEEEVDRTLGIMQRFFREFRDWAREDETRPAPDRT